MMVQVQKFIFNLFQENCYVIWGPNGNAAIIDPGCESQAERNSILDFISKHGLKPGMVLLTHGHLDHIYGAAFLSRELGIPVMMHRAEEASVKEFNLMLVDAGLPNAEEFEYQAVEDGDLLNFDGGAIRVLATPGHSMGGVCYWLENENMIFTGDTLFNGSIGRTDNKWASLEQLKASLKNTLMALDGEIDVYPGHGPATSIGRERLMNPFINDEFGELGYQD